MMMFPVMLLGPSCSSGGLHDLFRRMRRVSAGYWDAALLIPPAPNAFLIGISFGLVAGFFEEIGWMGYAFPRSVWHLPVTDHIGTAPRGSSQPP